MITDITTDRRCSKYTYDQFDYSYCVVINMFRLARLLVLTTQMILILAMNEKVKFYEDLYFFKIFICSP